MIALLAGGFLAYRSLRSSGKTFWTARTMSVGAMCMALASVLSLIKLWTMPMGGAITPASMLPLLLFAYCYGTLPGLTLGALYGVMQYLLDGMRFAALGAIPNLLDYPIAFGLLGLAGLFGKLDNQKLSLTLGFVLGCFGRFLASFTSGYVYYGMYAPEGWNPAVYSIVYNGTYLLPECIICIALGLLIAPRLVRELRRLK
ncbi:MAG: energy-coupled thiamine transporter ThiT [Clostridia bacterium]|nr:energy-coupled thiamine transporter ThiT [Clostridia bacterium]